MFLSFFCSFVLGACDFPNKFIPITIKKGLDENFPRPFSVKHLIYSEATG